MKLSVEFSFEELRRIRILVGTKIKGCRYMQDKIENPKKLNKALYVYECIYEKVNDAFPEEDRKGLDDFIKEQDKLKKGFKKGYKKSEN